MQRFCLEVDISYLLYFSIARRLSAQSERNSFSDVDSPSGPTGPSGPANQTAEMTKQEIEVATASSNAETTSPLLSSLLKSPTTTTAAATTPALPPSQNVQVNDVVDDVEVKHVDEKDVVVDEPMEINDDSVAANVDEEVVVNDAGEDVEQKSEENVEELLAAAVDEVSEKMPDLIQILAGVENGESAVEAVNEVEVKAAAESNDVVIENGVKPEADVPPLDVDVAVVAIKQEGSESCADEQSREEVSNFCDVEKREADADVSSAVTIKTEDEGQADDKAVADEDKPLTSDLKRQTKVTPSKGSGRRSRKQSDVNADEDSNDGRRETRSKKTSERSDECSGTPGTVSGNLETASEESPLPPPSAGARETRRSAAKKVPNSDAADGNDSVKDEKEDVTSLNVAENRRVSRLKEKEASGEISWIKFGHLETKLAFVGIQYFFIRFWSLLLLVRCNLWASPVETCVKGSLAPS